LSIATFALGLAVTACTQQHPIIQKEVAQRIAAPAWMVDRQINTGSFTLSAYERMHKRHAPADVYIEGNSEDLKNLNGASPFNPVALHLSSRDKADNVVWLGRPCQFDAIKAEGESCTAHFMSGKEYSAEVLEGYKNALNNIKYMYDISEFNLIGYNGGAAIAALLAAARDDVASLRTVAGVLNPPVTGEGLLSPIQFGEKLENIPQYHFIGDLDETANLTDIDAYMQALGSERCTNYEIVQDANHEEGWVNKWPDLLAKTPICSAPAPEPEPEIIVDPRPPAIYYPRDEKLIK
jgi:hypothetical protein